MAATLQKLALQQSQIALVGLEGHVEQEAHCRDGAHQRVESHIAAHLGDSLEAAPWRTASTTR